MVAPKSDLKRFLDAKTKPTRVLGDLERLMLSRQPGDRSTTVLHPSEIIKQDWCRRASYFLLSGYTKVAEKPGLRLQRIFDTGHDAHARWQSYFHELGVLHGKFKCLACEHVDFGTSVQQCSHCGTQGRMVYDEVALINDELRIAGHTDGWLKGLGDDCLIEIKTIGPGTLRMEASQLMAEANGDFMAAWKNVKHPFGPHILQGLLYIELMNHMGNSIDEIVFLYDLKADQDYREFVVKRNPGYVDHVFANAAKVVAAVKAGSPPACNNNPSGRCKQCSPYREV